MAAPIKVTDETFALAIEVQPLVVVDFWAPWCAPCRALGPIIDRLAERYEGRVTFAKLEVDENPDTPLHYRVQSIPALLFFRNGTLVDRTVGALPESLLATKLDQLLKAPVAVSVRISSPSPQAA
jgi:thioredoxin 1